MTPPHTVAEWREFLRGFSDELLSDPAVRAMVPEGMLSRERPAWLGYEGASDENIAAVELRLGRELPPSYRRFLNASNGWRVFGAFIYDLLPCQNLYWFRERHQDWIDAYLRPDLSAVRWPLVNGHPTGPREPSESECLVDGADQNTSVFRSHHLQTALAISDIGDSAIMLLNPSVVTPLGEWEAWFFANWLPGARRYPSFADLAAGERAVFRTLMNDER